MSDTKETKLFGLVGYPGSGKDAVTAELCKWGGYTRYAFGDAVKALLLAIDPTYENSRARLERWKRKGVSDTRAKLQRLGQRLRDFDPDFWVNSMPTQLSNKSIVTDIRYQNELDWVKNQGGIIVAIHREGYGPINDHQSERNTTRLLNMADHTLHNNGTIKELAARFHTLL